jgi:signal transduction histidine kinase
MPMKIILIDCSDTVREYMAGICVDSPLEVFAFSGEDDLAQILHDSDFDLVIAGIDGYPPRWWSSLVEIKSSACPPAVIFIGEGSQEELRAVQKMGANFYLFKPVNPTQLKMIVKFIGCLEQREERIEALENELHQVREHIDRLVQEQKDASIEQKLTYQELSLAYAQLQDLSKKKNNFISLATHELKTPITVIKGYHRILLDERLGQLSTQQRDILLESEQNCVRLNRIVNSLLDFSRMEAGRFELVYQENDFAESLAHLLSQVEVSCHRKNLRLEVHLDPEIPRFKYDRERINQVLLSLLENAIKYTPAGGAVVFSARPYFWERRSQGVRKIRGMSRRRPPRANQPSNALNSLYIEVQDTGVGISKEDQRRIFEEFSQGSSARIVKSGLGLGLSIARHIIDAHRGKIWVESEPQQGSKFLIILPLNPAEIV